MLQFKLKSCLAATLALLVWISTVISAAHAETQPGATTVHVAVASNFTETHNELAKLFEKQTGHRVKSSTGSTGKLYAQITNGGPFDVFLSADSIHATRLIDEKIAVAASQFTYALGRLALFAPRTADSVSAQTLTNPAIKHFAVANPETAPYGLAAIAVLEKLDALAALKERLVFGENIAQTIQFVESGGAEAGLVAYSQVIKRDPKQFWLVPETLHAPIAQDAVLLARGTTNPAATAFLEFLKSAPAQTIIESFGNSVPAKPMTAESP